jgi:Na+-transporting methylmalonyl-CoA/oxaloacetate decarboxylase gamma subunit
MNFKNLAPILIWGAIGFIVGFLFFSFILAIVIGVIGAVIGFIGGKFFAGEKIFPEEKEEPLKEQSISAADQYINQLFALNFTIRRAGLNPEFILAVENVIDKTKNLIPILNREENFSDLTVTVNRIPGRYLSSIIDTYLELSADSRKDIEAKMLKNLSSLDSELDRIQEAVDNGQKDKYQRMSVLIDKMFEENEVGGI